MKTMVFRKVHLREHGIPREEKKTPTLAKCGFPTPGCSWGPKKSIRGLHPLVLGVCTRDEKPAMAGTSRAM